METSLYHYKVQIRRIVDGDTVDCDIDCGFGIWLKNSRVRLKGVDAPENRSRDLDEKAFGIAAKERLREILPVGSTAIVKTYFEGNDKYGRILGEFYDVEGQSINYQLVMEHHAIIWTEDLTEEQIESRHLANRKWLIENDKIDVEEIKESLR